MASDPPKDEPADLPLVAGVDVASALVEMDKRVAAAAVEAAIAGEVRSTEVVEAAPAAPAEPPEPVSPAKEWGAAVVLMIVFAFICATFISMLRS